MHAHLQCGSYQFSLSPKDFQPLVMGVLNLTPDSFSDGGRYQSLDAAIARAGLMMSEGADLIDIGGESSRPGAPSVPLQEELRRVMPVLSALRGCGKPLSLDTSKPEVMAQGILAGVDMINDIYAFRAPGAMEAVRDSDCALCIMHMQSVPLIMQEQPGYRDVVAEVIAFLEERVAALLAAGIARHRLVIDPGFGFGKTLQHNLLLLKNLGQIQAVLGLPLLAGLSRKSMIGAITGKPPEARLAGSLAAALAAVEQGAHMVRVHDVAETVDVLKIWQAVK